MNLGRTMLLANPTFEGYFTSMSALNCKGILPTVEFASFHNAIKINDTSDEQHAFSVFELFLLVNLHAKVLVIVSLAGNVIAGSSKTFKVMC